MSYLTTPEMIETMKALAALVEQDTRVHTATIDDWGRYGNFTLLVWPQVHTRTTTNQLKSLVRKLCNGKSYHLRQCLPPERTAEGSYHKDFWSFDLDYFTYQPDTNRFDVQERQP